MEYVLQTNALEKRYKHFKALNGLTMHVPKGAIYGFVGRNGAGKTTLIRIICGLQKPSGGSFQRCGIKNTDRNITRARRRMGAVVETPAIHMDLSARENLIRQYQIIGLPSKDEIDQLLKLVGLEHTGKKHARHFSLGMRQRLGIAMALAGSPDFLILDEPTNGLDPQGIIEIRELILELNQKHGITILISSHILDELSRVATHYGFINSGSMVEEISAQELAKVCRKCMQITVTSPNALARYLDAHAFEYQFVLDTQANIYGKPDISSMILELKNMGCDVLSMTESDETLESYFINLVGGKDNA